VITTRAAPGGKTADALAWRGAVERAHDSALLENHDLRRAGDDAQRRDATVLQRRSEPLPGAFADRAAHAVRVDAMKAVKQIVVATDLELRHEHVVRGAGGEASVLLGIAQRTRRLARRLAHELRLRVAVRPHIPARAVGREHRAR